jgi:hypothetical protein
MAFAASNAKKSNPARPHSLAPGTQKTLYLQGYPRKSEKDNACEKIVLWPCKNVYALLPGCSISPIFIFLKPVTMLQHALLHH